MHLVIIDAGGTISAVDAGQGFEGGELGLAALIADTEIAGSTTFEVRQVYRGLSEAMTHENVLAVVEAVRSACMELAVDAVVVAHGTDAMEETAFLCDLLLSASKPVIFTGAQRAPSEVGYDGTGNFTDAVLTAARPGASEAGVLIVFGGYILAAARARKVHAQALAAFGPDAAVVGRCSEASALAARAGRPLFGACETPAAAVEIFALGLGSDGRVLEAAAPLLDGIVLQAMGCGNASIGVVKAVEKAVRAGRLVGVVSGCFEGEAVPVYASGHRLLEAGALFMGDLDARRARMLMICALGGGRSASEAAALVTRWLRPD